MSALYSLVFQHSEWVHEEDYVKKYPRANSKIDPILFDRGSLTQVLIDLSNDHFNVNLLRQEVELPASHESEKLGLKKDEQAIIREVELQIHHQAVVFARSVIPLSFVGDTVSQLGTKPLGQLLFKDGKIRVSKREFAEIETNGQTTLARRTPYDYEQSQVLVAEYFLPEILGYL